jgi:hypothetical protein
MPRRSQYAATERLDAASACIQPLAIVQLDRRLAALYQVRKNTCDLVFLLQLAASPQQKHKIIPRM